MRDRLPPAPARSTPRRAGYSVDVVLLTPLGKQLAVLLSRADARARERWALPFEVARPEEPLDAAADRLARAALATGPTWIRSEEHTSELQSPCNLVCRLLLEKKKILQLL